LPIEQEAPVEGLLTILQNSDLIEIGADILAQIVDANTRSRYCVSVNNRAFPELSKPRIRRIRRAYTQDLEISDAPDTIPRIIHAKEISLIAAGIAEIVFLEIIDSPRTETASNFAAMLIPQPVDFAEGALAYSYDRRLSVSGIWSESERRVEVSSPRGHGIRENLIRKISDSGDEK
jgi:hypothetical protein